MHIIISKERIWSREREEKKNVTSVKFKPHLQSSNSWLKVAIAENICCAILYIAYQHTNVVDGGAYNKLKS